MFGFSMGEVLLISVIALIAIGPRQLPEVARTVGRMLNELKRATSDFQRAFLDLKDETDKSVHNFQNSVERAIAPPRPASSETQPSTPASEDEAKQMSFDLKKKGP